MRLHGVEDLLLGLGAEARQVADAAVLGRLHQLLERLDVEVVPQGAYTLRSQAGNAQQRGYGGRHLLALPFQELAFAGAHDLVDLLGEILADAGNVGECGALLDQGHEVRPQLADRARRVAIGAYAERVGALDVEQVGDLVEDGADGGVESGHEGATSPFLRRRGQTMAVRPLLGARNRHADGKAVVMTLRKQRVRDVDCLRSHRRRQVLHRRREVVFVPGHRRLRGSTRGARDEFLID